MILSAPRGYPQKPPKRQAFSTKKKVKFLKKSVDFLGDSAILFSVMRDMYYVKDEDGLFRMFDVSDDGLEDAI